MHRFRLTGLTMLSLLCQFCPVGVLQAAPLPSDYYNTVGSLQGAALKEELRQIISGNRGYTIRVISYDAARDALLNTVENVGGGNVKELYYSEIRPQSQWAISLNREHTWPQSYGASASPKKSDMHHLFLCDDSLNSARGNDLYGNVTIGSAVAYPSNSSPWATNDPLDTNYRQGTVWQVSAHRKGDVARAILYMDTRYVDFSLINRGQTLGTNQMGYLDDLLLWNSEDPVDAWEVQRNDRVFDFQNNRNPYIDNPSYVALVYGTVGGASTPALSSLTSTPPAPDASQTVSFSVNASDSDGLTSVQLFYRTGTSGPFTSIAMSPTVLPQYTTTSSIPMLPEGTVVQYFAKATDTLANTASLPPSGETGPYSYTVVGNLPVLSNLSITPSSPTATSNVSISADVTDNGGNTAANLTVAAFWRVVGAPGYTSVAMNNTSGTTWQTATTIPPQVAGTTVEYYVRATDTSAATATTPANGAMEPATYYVEEAAAFATITSAGDVVGKLLLSEAVAKFGADANTEYIELVNISQQGFVIDTLMLSDDGTADTGESFCRFPAGATIPPGGIIVVFHRASPSQAFVDSIPVESSINGEAVQVFALDTVSSPLNFRGQPVPEMVPGDGSEIQLNNAGDNVALVFGSTENYTLAQVIDGVGFGTQSDVTGWSPAVSTSGGSGNATYTSGTHDSIYRMSEVDTNLAADWGPQATGTYTPGAVPFLLAPSDVPILISGAGFSGNTLTISEGTNAPLSVSLATNPARTVTVSIAKTTGSDPFSFVGTPELVFTAANYSTPQTITFAKGVDGDAAADSATFSFVGDYVQARSITLQEVETTEVIDWSLL